MVAQADSTILASGRDLQHGINSGDNMDVTGGTQEENPELGDDYVLERELGGGGMSRVFVAEEVALGRRVVVKVLAPNLRDTVSVERFRREVRLAARLQHPHIVPLFAAGALPSGALFYSMPFLEGETLGVTLAREGALPVADVIALLRDIASALAYAHRHGVVHRDVKPGNVFRTEGGAVVADFGIAKAVRAARDGDGSASGDGTRSAALTQFGTSLGTPAYLAPEQAAGDEVDHRADLYSLGVVAYEMLAGRPPFEGRTAQQLLAAHVTERPEPLHRRRPTVPPGLAALVMRLLEKHPADRPQSADDVLRMLDTSASSAASGPHPGRSAVVRWLPWAVAAVAALAAVFATALVRRAHDAEPRPRVAAAIPLPAGLDPSRGSGAEFAVAPDGTRLAFVARDAAGRAALWVRPLDSLTARPVDGTEGASRPFWSPDGAALGFFAAGQLQTVDLRRGGPARTLCPVSRPSGGTWSSAGVIIYGPDFLGPLYIVTPAGGGAPTCAPLTHVRAGEFGHRAPSALPDGRHVLFSSEPAAALVADVTTGAITELRRGAADARFVAPHWLFFVGSESGPLFSQRLDLGSVRVVGTAQRVLDRVASIRGTASYSATADVLVSLDPALPAVAPGLLWVDRQGVVVDSGVAPDSVRRIAPSHDGRRLALWGQKLWLYDRDRRVATRAHVLASPEQAVTDVAWGPGDSLIAYGTARAGPVALWVYHLATDASDSLFSAGRRVVGAPDWSPDGRQIAFTLGPGPNAPTQEIWLYARDAGRATRAWATSANLGTPRWSPDGRWLAFTSDETGATEVYVRPVAGPGAAIRVSPAGGQVPSWQADGRTLFYQRGDGAVVAVGVTRGATTVQVTAPRVVLAAAPFARADGGVAVTPDGQQFVGFAAGTAPAFNLLLGWAAGLTPP